MRSVWVTARGDHDDEKFTSGRCDDGHGSADDGGMGARWEVATHYQHQ